ncbi:4-hydroxythreonine-4-phosphate dehydrogenase PdxA [Paludibacteraceae bacterium OttesenSCG-928-F17]|nr:4-hydroxythreonine-4-phosphate dehydrogenase PdxA [Paludibacteraceae bacterium OttesenSCG-928-F17]
MDTEKIIIGITHGDVNGIGYEVILKTLSDTRMLESFIPVIYGSSKVAAYYRKHLDIQNLNFNIINSVNDINPKRVNLINCGDDDIKVEFGRSTTDAGKSAYAALERATQDLSEGLIHAVVTAPINKDNIQSENFHFPGHTEYLAEKFGTDKSVVMMLVSDVMRVAVATGHIPLKEVPNVLTKELILDKLVTINESLKQDFGIIRPRIAVLGLNPHAGDEGLIGSEEKEIIIPAMQTAGEKGIICSGPYPADGFFGSDNFGKFDAILAMYHDQGLIPFKAVSMENGVNVTLGLSIIRTSPAHGTAYDIAGQNIASEESFRQAIYMASDMYYKRDWEKDIAKNPLRSMTIEKCADDKEE